MWSNSLWFCYSLLSRHQMLMWLVQPSSLIIIRENLRVFSSLVNSLHSNEYFTKWRQQSYFLCLKHFFPLVTNIEIKSAIYLNILSDTYSSVSTCSIITHTHTNTLNHLNPSRHYKYDLMIYEYWYCKLYANHM